MNSAKDKTGLFRGHLHVARMAYRSADYRAALRNLNSAQYAIEQTGQRPDDVDMHEFKRLYGKVYLALKHLDQAETAFREAFDLSSRGSFATARTLISDNRHIADCVRLRGKLQEAETIYKQCIEQLDLDEDQSDHQLAKSYLGLAQVYIDSKQLDKATQAIKTALSLFENSPGERSFWYGRTLVTQARLLWAQDHKQESMLALEQSLTIMEPLLGPDHPIRTLALARVAKVLNHEGDEKKASKIVAELKEIEKYLKDHDN